MDPAAPRNLPSHLVGALHKTALRLGLQQQIVKAATGMMTSKRRLRAAFDGYEPDEHDVFVAAWIKSGTNWAMQTALQIAWGGEAEFDHIHDLVPWPDAPRPGCVPLGSPASTSPSGLRIVKTHLDATWVPWSDRARYLVLLRDPKDVCVSTYHFLLPLLGVADAINPQQWLELMLARAETDQAEWHTHAASWWGLRDRPNVLLMRFADLKGDLPGAIDRIAAWMGVAMTEDARTRVIERAGFAWMKAHNHRFAPLDFAGVSSRDRPAMVRRGASGGASELYTVEQQRRIDEVHRRGLLRIGSDLPYDELFQPA